ncbi:MAG: DUF4364 family protein [Clostridia bacterium]|nr:DUF4364 family protein [Clostridia bacterium]
MANYDAITNKLIILFVMEKMEMPLTEKSIIEICSVKNDWVNYMDCLDLLYQLSESKLIYKTECKEDEMRYSLTFEGRDCLSYFYKKIPSDLQGEIAEFSKANRLSIKQSQEYYANYTDADDGSYLVTMRIYENLINTPLFELKIKAPTRQSAEEACKKWRQNAPNVYEYIYENFINTD